MSSKRTHSKALPQLVNGWQLVRWGFTFSVGVGVPACPAMCLESASGPCSQLHADKLPWPFAMLGCVLSVPCSPGEHIQVADMLAGVQAVLSDAAASMAAASSGSLSSAAGKSAWWQQRVGQDQRMARLVQQLDQQWLGPWRCLLGQPGQAAVEEAAAAAGQAIVSEHFDSVLGEWRTRTASMSMPSLLACTWVCMLHPPWS